MEFINNIFWYTIPFLIVLSVLIIVHEYGHYIIARFFGVKIEEFSLGFGKKLFSKKDKHGTEWKICAIPFGGYVKMFGDENGASAPNIKKLKKMTNEEKAVSFQYKKLYQRFLIVFSGPFFNYVFAILCFVFLFMSFGEQVTKPIISEVKAESAAFQSGLEVGDYVISYDDQKIEKFEDIKRITALNFGKEMPIVVKRGDIDVKMLITPETIEKKSIFGESYREGVIGILSNEVEFIKYKNPAVAIGQSFKYCNQMMTGTLKALGQIITGTRSGAELGGPLKIAKMSKDFAEQGFAALIYFIAVLSVNLALINLFPIPVLDGGHLLFYIIEGVIRKPVPEKIQEVCFKVGFGIILLLVIVITINDVKSLSIFDFIKKMFYK